MPDALAVAIRFGLYLDLMLLFGVAAFRLHALLSPSADSRSGDNGTGIVLTALAGVFLSMFGLAALAASMTGTTLATVDRASVELLLFETSVGTAGLVRLAALIVAALCGLFWRRYPRAASAGAMIAGGVAVASLAWSGHGVMDEGIFGWIHLGADVVHLLAAGIWIGALAALLRLALSSAPTNLVHIRQLHEALERFSAVGIVVVMLLVFSGFANSLFLIGAASLGAILTASWSQLLLLKLLLFAAMLLLAIFNRFHLTPTLAGTPTDKTLRQLRLSLTLETSAAVLILLLVAWLGSLEPPVSTL